MICLYISEELVDIEKYIIMPSTAINYLFIQINRLRLYIFPDHCLKRRLRPKGPAPRFTHRVNFDFQAAFGLGNALTWDSLINEYRVILLSEAGAGKTVEIRQAARRQRANGKTNDEGWLFLDSVDEARLKEPADFDRAIRKLGLRLSLGLQRAHIFISSHAKELAGSVG